MSRELPEVGSEWVVQVDYPENAGVRVGDVVEVAEVGTTEIIYTNSGCDWVADTAEWHMNFKPKEKTPTESTEEVSQVSDNVNSPSHYGQGSIEAIDYIQDFLTEEEFIGYLRGNIAKYLHRFRYKGKPAEDLKKAEWYLKRLIEVFEDG